MQKYSLKNLDCANCAIKIEDTIRKIDGVHFVNVDFGSSTLFLDAEDLQQVKHAITQVEPEIEIGEEQDRNNLDDLFNVYAELTPIIFSGSLFIIGLIFYNWLNSTPWAFGEYFVFGFSYWISGSGVLMSAFRNISRGHVFDEQFLMSVATLGAIAIGEVPEAAGVMLFYLIGEFLQGFSIKRSRTSIKALLETHPDFANQVINGENKLVHPESLLVGDIIMVKPGEKIPIDGEIIRGNSQVDASPLTGESRPWVVKPGDMIYAGSMNITGLLSIEVVRPVADSSISRILELVESAANRKTQAEKFITKFAKVYSPIVVLIALGVAIIPPLIMGANFSEWLYRALVILVISCPCALVISIPLGYFGGVGAASRKGILVKGSNFLDILASVDTVVFDKTGTLTNGVFKVTQVVPRNGFSENELIFFAAQAEEGLNHPIATSIREAYRGKPLLPVLEQLEILGQGVQTTVGGRILLAGNDPLLHRENIIHETDICNINGTVVHVAVDGKYAGFILISDEIKDDSIDAVQLLRSIGISHLVMLTGDNQETAAETASLLGLDDYEAALLPEGKINAVEKGALSKAEKPEKIAFVGDGINDAPALARADVGIAMGGLGSDVAIETADVVILADSPIKVAEAIEIGRKTRNIVYQNIILALAIKTGFIAMGVAGHASMWQAVFGDMGVALLALFNASRVFSKERVR